MAAEPGGAGGQVPRTDDRELRVARNLGVGCFTAVAGFWSGAMFAVLIGKFVGSAQGCAAGENGQPCNWQVYAAAGAVFGSISLPALTLWRLRRRDAAATPSA